MDVVSKDVLRQQTLAVRSSLSPANWHAEDARRDRHVLEHLPHSSLTVAAYVPRPAEPGTDFLLEEVRGRGHRVLLPILAKQPDWAWFAGVEDLVSGRFGIRQPSGIRLGPGALSWADLVVVPCLGVAADGTRLGTGGGWYDRALRFKRDGAQVWALARAAEVVESLPSEPHDIPVDAVVTEAGFRRLR